MSVGSGVVGRAIAKKSMKKETSMLMIEISPADKESTGWLTEVG